ncbi:TA system VapC family ribonuclease toxin [Aquabacterium sp.]|uniref:TA system VapC family ribonuclease toxin n=1 Tax=Aquabacterium sp. TaxID=1872578 RepID=UPI002B6ABA2D|nr:TA system VapC family ribonuclease toxin [Aquabacterium sp.]HSW03409.1 TA system VapC family ribonuclease toxin [Aquabacterium sp.]
MTPDVNVLVAASRSDHPHHGAAHAWLLSALAACSEGATLRLPPMVVSSFLRLVTSPKIFKAPTPVDDAIGFVDALLAVPGVQMPLLGTEWPLLRQLCLDKQLRGNDLPDAWLAAAVVQLSEHLATFDLDFRKLLRPADLTVLAPA